MKHFTLFFLFVLSITLTYGQDDNQNLSHDGLLEQVFDNYGKPLKLKDIAIIPKKSIVDNSTILSSNLLLTTGIFEIYFEDGSGMELNNATHEARRNVVNQVFTDISHFLNTPLKENGNLNKVKVWIRSFDEISEIVPEQNSYGTSYYNTPKNTSSASIVDNQLWKIINGGKNPYENISNSQYNGSVLEFYHAAFSFNFNQNWNTSLLDKASSVELDLYTQVFREVVHALGFNSLINGDGTSKFGTDYKYYSRFDKYLVNQNNLRLISSSNGTASMINYNFTASLSNLDNCSGADNTCSTINKFRGTNDIKLNTPNCFIPNATLQFTDFDCNNSLSDNWLMRYNIGEGETQRFMNEYERQILIDLGYGFGNNYGEAQHFSSYDYDLAETTTAIVGYNDGLTTNSYVFTGNVGATISLTNLVTNDSYNNINFENLVDLTSSATQFSATSGAFNTTIQTVFNTPGVHLLSYIPYNTITGIRGNITYVHVFVKLFCGALNPDPCNYVTNGNFETNIGMPTQLGQLEELVCNWYEGVENPDYFHRFSTSIDWDIPNNIQSNTQNPTNSIAPGSGNAYSGIVIDRSYYPGDTFTGESEIIIANLNTPLLPNTNYNLSFHVLKSAFSTVNAEIQACFVKETMGFPLTQTDAFTGNFIPPAGSILIDNDSIVSNADAWENINFNFTTDSNAGHNFLYISGLVNPQFTNFNNDDTLKYIYCYIDNVVLTPVFNPTLDLPNSICVTETSFDLSTYLTGGISGGHFEIDDVAIVGTTFNPNTYTTGDHVISYVIPNTIACEEIEVTDTIFFSNCIPNAPYISQVYVNSGRNKAVEVKNKNNTNAITSGMYYLVWYQGSGLSANLTSPTGSVDLAFTSPIAANGVKVFKGSGFSSPGYVNSLVTDVLNLNSYDGFQDVIIISTSNGANAYNDRIDVLGDNSPVLSVMHKEYTMEEYRSLVRVSCMPLDRQPPQVFYDEQDWVGFNRYGTNATGTFDESIEITNEFSKTNAVLGRHYSDVVEWSANPLPSWDDLGIIDPTNESNPDRSRTVLISFPYDTFTFGNFEACSLISNDNLVINATNYAKVQTKVTSSPPTNGIVVQDNGSLVQVRDKFYAEQNQQLISVNGVNSFKHSRTTNGIDLYSDYVYWSSPLSANLSNLPINSFFPLGYSPGEFRPQRFYIFENANFNDSSGTYYDDQAYTDPYNINLIDYVPFSILPNYTSQKFIPGRGYLTWPPDDYPTNYTIEFKGEMNNGEVLVPIYNNNSVVGQNPNLVGNPYPSPIDLNILFTVNYNVIEPLAIIWGRAIDDPNGSYPGPNPVNYLEDNYLIYNPTLIVDPSFTGNDSFNSEGILASCQSFIVRAKGGTNYIGAGNLLGNLKFSNVMRSTMPNTTFAKTSSQNTISNSSLTSQVNEGKVWLNLNDNQGYTVQQGIAFLNDKQDDYVISEDIEIVNGRKYNFYSQINSKDLIINLMGAFDDTKIIPLGITNISENLTSSFTISIPKKEGVFNTQTIYLYDALLNVVHNLSASSYVFTTSEIVTENRFYLQFTNTSSNLAKESNEEVVVYSKDGVINISSKQHNITEVNVIDLYHVKDGIKSVASAKQQHTKSVQLKVDDLSKLMEVTITLENGTIIHKKIFK